MEVLKKIAVRIAPGDRWGFVGEVPPELQGKVFEGLTETLNAYFEETNYQGAFLLEPLQGKISIVDMVKEALPERKKYNLYGES